MQYQGGKSRIAKWLCAAISPVRFRADASPRGFWDPFCGGLSMAVALSDGGGGGLVTDSNPALIALYKAIAAGWDPPTSVTEEEYAAARALPDSDPRKAFIGFGVSFGGKWFGGLARPSETYVQASRNVLQRDIGALVAAGCDFDCVDFLDVEPFPMDDVLYLDPPYADTASYKATGKFDHTRFYERVRQWAIYTDVFVSEYKMPFGRPLLEFTYSLKLGGGERKDARCERFFHYGPNAPPGLQ